jgi:hypothetical protein
VVIFLPQILLLFFFVAILEDSGYLARAALIADRTMARVGLQGKSFIPLLSAYACAVPAIMATRTIENKRDRIATILIAPFMTCSARLPVYAGDRGTIPAGCRAVRSRASMVCTAGPAAYGRLASIFGAQERSFRIRNRAAAAPLSIAAKARGRSKPSAAGGYCDSGVSSLWALAHLR